MSDVTFQTLDELTAAFSSLKRNRELHPIVERRLALLLQEMYPDANPVPEPLEMAGGRSDLALYFPSGRYVLFELFATVSQVAQDLRHLEQSGAHVRIAVLPDRVLDNGRIIEEYSRKKPRHPFPHITLSEILVLGNEAATRRKLKSYIGEGFALDEPAGQIHRMPAEMGSLPARESQPVGTTPKDEALAELSTLVARAHRRFAALSALVKRMERQARDKLLADAREAKEAHFDYLDTHRIHIPEDLCNKLDKYHQMLDRTLTDYELSQAYDHTKDEEAFSYMHRGFEMVTISIPEMRRQIEQELRRQLTDGREAGERTDEAATTDIQVGFSYRLISIDSEADEHLYGLEMTVENQGSQAVDDFKLEFGFPNLDLIPRRWRVAGFLGNTPPNMMREPPGRLVVVDPADDSVSVHTGPRAVRVTYRSRDTLFPGEQVALTEAIGLQYRINRSVYANIDDMPELEWTLYADDMPRKQGSLPLSELNNY